MASVNMASGLTAGVYTSDGVACTNGYSVIPVSWTGLNGYPELVVEQSIDNSDYYPAMVADDIGYLRPIKLRMIDTAGKEMLTVDGVKGDTPYTRVVIYGGDCDEGVITFENNIG